MAISAKDVMALRQKTGAGMMDCKKALTETDGDFEAAIKYLREKGISRAEKRSGREANEGRVSVIVSDDRTAGAMVEINSETDFVARNDEFVELVDHYTRWTFDNGAAKAVDGLVPEEAFELDRLSQLAGKIGENLTLRRAAYVSLENGFVDSYIHPGDQLGVLLVLNGEASALQSDAVKELSHDLTLQIAASAPQFVRPEEVPEEVTQKEIEIYKTQMRNEGKPEQMLEKIAAGKLNKFFEEICLLEQPFVKEMKMKVKDRVAQVAKELGSTIDVASFVRFKVGEGESEGE